jgi:AAA+ superfamily predicted ATPase
MTTTRKLADLFRALGAEDLAAAKTIAGAISKSEDRKGHRIYARELRSALNGSRVVRPRSQGAEWEEIEPLTGGGLLNSALMALNDSRSLDDVFLSGEIRRELDEVVVEWEMRELLKRHGVPRRTRLLFHGPPGCGKSLTASGLGRALKLPVYLLRFDAVIGAFLGQTALRLRQVFHFAESTPCVLVLDELDALGKRRGNPLDVGELDRIVIALMQELEHSAPAGMVIATTNMAEHLDDALWRRFDLSLEFSAPSRQQIKTYVTSELKRRNLRLDLQTGRRALDAKSFAEAEKEVLAQVRKQLMRRGPKDGS